MKSKERFQAAMWANLPKEIVIGGAGSISSWAALFLSRSNNHTIFIVDFDTVEEVNLAGQFFGKKDIGEKKIDAIVDNINLFNYPANPIQGVFDRIENVIGLVRFNYMISGFDNMDARKYMFDVWKSNPDRKLFIDARLTAEQYEVYFVTQGREDDYEKTLFPQSESAEVACSFKSTSHFAAMCGTRICQGFNSFIANEAMEDDIYTLPFKHSEIGINWNIEIES